MSHSIDESPDFLLSSPASEEAYRTVAAAIAFIRQNRTAQPDLKTVAEHVNLSESHFQKLLTRWAGISPKRFLQYLTLEQAKARLEQTRSLLELSADLGLSGPSRLHDLFVSIEAMSPGEYQREGAGLDIRYGLQVTRFGQVLIAATPRGICSLQFWDTLTKINALAKAGECSSGQDCSPAQERSPEQWLLQTWPNATLTADEAMAQELCKRIFSPVTAHPTQPLTLLIKGTNFQLQVWRSLLQIPLGGVVTYQSIANKIERPKAVRAVGSAIGKNPVGYLIPCHRVIRGSGELGGYRWGLDRKQAILAWEAIQSQQKSR